MARVRRVFDRDFFQRYYDHPGTAVVHADEALRRSRFVMAYLDFLGVEVHTVLDAGCGVGLWKKALRRLRREVEYTGIDTSEYLCARHGWRNVSVAAFRSRRHFDLVICQDVLQYLNRDEVRGAVDAIARVCRHALYVDVPTREDFDDGTLNVLRTDRDIHVRGVRWYRRLLDEHFVSAGGGVFLPHRSRVTLLALEHG